MSESRICLTHRQLKEMRALDPVLQCVVEDALFHWPGDRLEVVSIYRTAEENTAAGARTRVHVTNPHRAADLRIRNLGDGLQRKADAVAEVLNTLWSYDPKRSRLKVAISKPHGTGPHIHIQVHPRTIRRPL